MYIVVDIIHDFPETTGHWLGKSVSVLKNMVRWIELMAEGETVYFDWNRSDCSHRYFLIKQGLEQEAWDTIWSYHPNAGHLDSCPDGCGHAGHWWDMSLKARELFVEDNPGKGSFRDDGFWGGREIQRPALINGGFGYWEARANQYFDENPFVQGDEGPESWVNLYHFDKLGEARKSVIDDLERRKLVDVTRSNYQWQIAVYALQELPAWLARMAKPA
jgi:hypothetical protein